jgi:nucleotide-binding universal stress UspA family protein
MSCESLLVLLDDQPDCAARTRTALALARRLDCHLLGLAPTGPLELPAVSGSAAALADFAVTSLDLLRDRAERIAERFRRDCREAGLRAFEAIVDAADTARSMVRHAHCSDLTLLTQADPNAPGYRAARERVETVVLHSARPTLILPHARPFGSIGSRVLVAWDDSREAARAVSDALPLLRGAEQVRLASWGEADGSDPYALQAQLDRVQRWLGRHGVDAQVHLEGETSAIAAALLARATDWGSDLIVMGAYGHARWTERMLGGATRGLLRSMTVPVLMSH